MYAQQYIIHGNTNNTNNIHTNTELSMRQYNMRIQQSHMSHMLLKIIFCAKPLIGGPTIKMSTKCTFAIIKDTIESLLCNYY
jgi:hypothetical protein